MNREKVGMNLDTILVGELREDASTWNCLQIL